MMGSFALFATLSAKTGNRMYAELMTRSMMDRIRTHYYGDPEPFNWNSPETLLLLPDVEMSKALKGRKGSHQDSKVNTITFYKHVEYENGSFIGKTQDNYDVITITIRWSEKSPSRQYQLEGGPAQSGLKVVTEVRRNIPDQKE